MAKEKEVNHIVLFKVSKSATKKQIDAFYKNLYKLKSKIKGIVSISGGENTSPENYKKGYTEGFIMKFKDSSSRDKYINHPEHLKFIKAYVDPIFPDGLVYDF